MSNPSAPDTAALIVRPMVQADLSEAIALWTAAEGVSVAEGDSPAELAAYLARNPDASQVAYVGGTLVGAVLAGHDGRRGLLYHLAVAPSQRGRGLGRILASQALEVLRGQSIRRVLILVAADNPAGRSFWLHCGWEGMEFAQPMGIDL